MSSADYTYPKMREHSIPNPHPHVFELGYHSYQTVPLPRLVAYFVPSSVKAELRSVVINKLVEAVL